MPGWIVLGVLAVLVLAVTVVSYSQNQANSNPSPGRKEFVASDQFMKKSLLTDAKHAFFARLQQAVGSELNIFAKVRLIDVVEPRRSSGERQGARNRVIQKHVDFLLVGRNFDPIAAVELDDRSHSRSDRQERDRIVEDILRSVGLPLVRFRVQAAWDPVQLRATIAEELQRTSATHVG